MPRGGARQGAGRKAGRRSQRPERKAIHKSVSLTPDKWRWIDDEASAKGVTRSSVVSQAVEDFMAKKDWE